MALAQLDDRLLPQAYLGQFLLENRSREDRSSNDQGQNDHMELRYQANIHL